MNTEAFETDRPGPKPYHSCAIEKCDIFDFMTHHVGLTVLHPGGLAATRRMARACQIGKDTRVLDVGCGKGTSSVYLAKHYGCKAVGIDLSQDSIDAARQLAARKGLDDRVTFEVGDAQDLRFRDGEFDAVFSQALLVLVKDRLRTVREALRIAKPGGRLGWLELSWWEGPPPGFMHEVSEVVCAYCLRNVETFEEWKSLFDRAGLENQEIERSNMRFQGLKGMLADEGLANSSRIMMRYLLNSKVRRRMDTLQKFFQNNQRYFGYGIYNGMKPL